MDDSEEIEAQKCQIQEEQVFNSMHLQGFTLIQPQEEDWLYLVPQYSNEKIELRIDLAKNLGEGSFSSIKKGFLLTKQGKYQPIVIKLAKETKENWQANGYYVGYEDEVDALSKLSECKEAVKMIGAFYTKVNHENLLWIILQKCMCSLTCKMKEIKENKKLVFQVVDQLINYLDYAHKINLNQDRKKVETSCSKDKGNIPGQLYKKNCIAIIHKDLKPANILIRSISMEKVEIAVADFGMAMICESFDSVFKKSFGGTPSYFGPEMLKKTQYDSRADCWNLGVILFDLLGGKRQKVLFLQNQRFEAMKLVAKKYCDYVDGYILEQRQKLLFVLRNCLKLDLKDRMFSSDLRYGWFNYEEFTKERKMKSDFKKEVKRAIDFFTTLQILILEEGNKSLTKLYKCLLKKTADQCSKWVNQRLDEFKQLYTQKELQILYPIFDIKKLASNMKMPNNEDKLIKCSKGIIGNPSFSQKLQDQMSMLPNILKNLAVHTNVSVHMS